MVPGTQGSIANSRCSIEMSLASRIFGANSVTLNLPMRFQAGTFSGTKNAYVNAFDNFGLLTHWVQGPVVTVP
jgi:hypothetical protein